MDLRLPSTENGYLPYWLLLLSVVSIGNSVQSFTTTKYTREIYAATTVTHLQARTFGTWTAVASIVRIVAAYNVHDPPVYLLAFATYAVAGFHFWSELLVFRTAKVNRATIGPLVIATVSLVWMWQQWDNYVKT